jgi:membrane protease subunit (stomatin/prohibitin family)
MILRRSSLRAVPLLQIAISFLHQDLTSAYGRHRIQCSTALCGLQLPPGEEFMSLRSFIGKQFIDVIDWTEPADGILAYRYPMQDREIRNGGQLTVRDAQLALFINEGKIADQFAPGLYTLTTQTLPVLTYLMNWDKAFQSPFKSDVYFFSTRMQTDQHWGTPNPITVRDKEFGAVRLRAFGIYSYHLADPKVFYEKISGTRDQYMVADLEGQLRDTIIGILANTFAQSNVPFLDMAANQTQLAQQALELLKPGFANLGLTLDTFVVENLSLPDELQKMLDQRISMNMIGDMNKYTQFQAAQSMPIAAANEGGGAGLGAGLGVGMGMAQTMMNSMKSASGGNEAAPTAAAAGTKFCMECGKPMPSTGKFCPNCGKPQS